MTKRSYHDRCDRCEERRAQFDVPQITIRQKDGTRRTFRACPPCARKLGVTAASRTLPLPGTDTEKAS